MLLAEEEKSKGCGKTYIKTALTLLFIDLKKWKHERTQTSKPSTSRFTWLWNNNCSAEPT
jgi:hypothetical protein